MSTSLRSGDADADIVKEDVHGNSALRARVFDNVSELNELVLAGNSHNLDEGEVLGVSAGQGDLLESVVGGVEVLSFAPGGRRLVVLVGDGPSSRGQCWPYERKLGYLPAVDYAAVIGHVAGRWN